MAEKKEVAAKKVDSRKWIERKFMAINQMKDERKAKEIADRVMSNKRG